MSDNKKTENKSDEEILEDLRKFSKKALEGLFDEKNKPDFDEAGVLAGDEELLKKRMLSCFPTSLLNTQLKKKSLVLLSTINLKSDF